MEVRPVFITMAGRVFTANRTDEVQPNGIAFRERRDPDNIEKRCRLPADANKAFEEFGRLIHQYMREHKLDLTYPHGVSAADTMIISGKVKPILVLLNGMLDITDDSD